MITKHQLITALFDGGPLITDGKVLLTIVNEVAREDGSNRNYNVTGWYESKQITIFVRTID